MDVQPITDLVASLNAVAGLDASTDASQLRVPGVLVQVRGHRADRLAGGTWLLQLVAIAPDLGPDRSLAQLATTLGLLDTVVDLYDDATSVAVAMPDGPPLPGMAVPFELPYT